MPHVTPGALWGTASDPDVTAAATQELVAAALPSHSDLTILETKRGGMGEVFIAEFKGKSDANRVALKTFQKKFFFEANARIAFEREATTWTRLTGCLHVMPALGLDVVDQRLAVRMLAVSTEPVSVRDMLSAGALDPEDVLAIALQVALGMRSAATRLPGLVHGDLKPDNLLTMGGQIWISDFGLARVVDPTRADLPLQSTYAYQAPELFTEPGHARATSDIYAFGLMLYELLDGAHPIGPLARLAAQAAHKDLSLTPIGTPPDLTHALSKLACACSRKVASERPQDFKEVFNKLTEIAHMHDPVGLFALLHRAQQQTEVSLDLQRKLAPSHVDALLKLNHPKSALDLVLDLEKDGLPDSLKVTKPTLLSLSGREAEALEAFDALRAGGDLSADHALECEIERALTLKRLGEIDEAAKCLEPLRWRVADADLPRVTINLASVHLMAGSMSKVVDLLEPFCTKSPGYKEAWANLGLALARLGRKDPALHAFSQALALDPSLGEVHVGRAAVHMDLQGDYESAFTALDLAFDMGFESREWFVRMVVAGIATGRKQDVSALLSSGSQNIAPDIFDAMKQEIETLRTDLRADGSVPPKYVQHLRYQKPEQQQENQQPTQTVEDWGDSATSAKLDETTSQEFKTPFMNTRQYGSDGSYSLDFYEIIESPRYVESFVEGAASMRRVQEYWHLRRTPFYMSVCSGCAVVVCTNRDVGKQLACRRCGHRAPTEISTKSSHVRLVRKINAELGMEDTTSLRKLYVLLALQTETDDMQKKAIEIGNSAGFQTVSQHSMALAYLQAEGRSRGTFSTDRPVIGLLSIEALPQPAKSSELPVAVDRLMREMRSALGIVRSSSASFDPEDPRILPDLDPAFIVGEIARLKVATSGPEPADINDLEMLSHWLQRSGEAGEALQIAKQIAERRPTDANSQIGLGQLALTAGLFDIALTALERSTQLDPANAVSHTMLAHAYSQTGQTEKAAASFARAQSLGGAEAQIAQGMRAQVSTRDR